MRKKLACGNCGKCLIGHPYTLDQCRLCWLALHDERYMRKWDVDEVPVDPQSRLQNRRKPCIHRGPFLGKEIVCGCPVTMPQIPVPFFACGIYGKCTNFRATSLRSCRYCQDYAHPDDRDQYPFDSTTPVEEVQQRFFSTGTPWPIKRWQRWPNVIEAFRLAFDQAAVTVPEMPAFTHDHGIAICGGGPKYFPSAYVAVRIIRQLGCDWPIELWHLGPEEKTPEMEALMAVLGGVTWRDGYEVAKQQSVRCDGGWPLKALALAYSDFGTTLLIDADCYPVFHPQELLDQREFRRTGAVFYPDSTDLKPEIYDWFGVPRHPDNLSFESGQMVVDKRRHWLPTWLALWLNHNAAYCYEHVYGDKDTFLLAWLKAGHDFEMPTRRPHCHKGCFIHADFAGRYMFVHRIHSKYHFAAWGVGSYASTQNKIDSSEFPRDDWAKAAVDTGDVYVSAPISSHEPWLAATLPESGRTALDIGANKGVWASELGKRFQRTIAFEPQAHVCRQLEFVPNIEVRQVALWHEPGELTIHSNGDHRESTVFDPKHWSRVVGTEQVPAVTLDSLQLDEVDFIKIDTEGAEMNILRGGVETLTRCRPTLLIECHGEHNERECVEILAALGYEPQHIANPITPTGSTWLWCRP